MNSRPNDSGFTLIELLVAMTLSLIVMTGIYSSFHNQQRSYIDQEQVVSMQQNLRSSVFLVSRDTRMAGFGYQSDIFNYYDGAAASTRFAVEIINNAGSPDRLEILYADANRSSSLTTAVDDSSDPIFVDGTDDFQVDDLIILTDGNNASLFQITGIDEATKELEHDPGTINPPVGINIVPVTYGTGAKVYKARYFTYSIDETDADHPRLVLDPDSGGPLSAQTVAGDIEDLQLAYVFANTSTAYGYNDGDINNNNDRDDVRAVRISIVGRVQAKSPSATGKRPALEDRDEGETDNYRRMALTSTVRVRNLGL